MSDEPRDERGSPRPESTLVTPPHILAAMRESYEEAIEFAKTECEAGRTRGASPLKGAVAIWTAWADSRGKAEL